MQVLFESIWNKYNGSSGLKAATTGGMYFTEAPQGSSYPYGVYNLISDVPSWVFGTGSNTTMENCIIQFNLFDDNSSSEDINTAYTALTGLYDWCNDLNTSGYSNIYMKRELSSLTRESGIFNYMIQYRIEIQAE
ncbi:hypothetical protein ES708_16200 [subsurface metagenome]